MEHDADTQRLSTWHGLPRAALVSLALLCGPRAAQGETGAWRYCLAASRDLKSIYVSQEFAGEASPASGPASSPPSGPANIQDEFDSFLSGAIGPHLGAQCPRAPTKVDAAALRKAAIAYQAGRGAKVISVPWPSAH